MCRIYCDGVLVPSVSIPDWVSRGWRSASTFRIVLNIRRSAGTRLDLSRREITQGTATWNHFVKAYCVSRFRVKAKRIVAQKAPAAAYYSLSRLLTYGTGFHIQFADLLQNLEIPLVALDDGGVISLLPSSEQPRHEASIVPRSIAENLGTEVMKGWATNAWLSPNPVINEWAGGMSIFGHGMTYGTGSDSFESLRVAEWLQEGWLASAHELRKVRFLSPGKKKGLPLMQEIWEERARVGKKGGTAADMKTRTALAAAANSAIKSFGFYYDAARFVEFASPFESFFTAGWRYLNVLHPTGAGLAECIRTVSDAENAGTLDGQVSGRLKDLLRSMFGERRFSMRDYLYGGELEKHLRTVEKLFKLAEELNLFALDHEVSWSGTITNVPATVKSGRLGEPIQELSVVGIH